MACPQCGSDDVERTNKVAIVGGMAAAGAAWGSFLPVIGTIAGGLIGAGLGAIADESGAVTRSYRCNKCEHKWGKK